MLSLEQKLMLRLAEEESPSPADEQELLDASQLIPPAIMLRLRQAFTIRGLPYFEFYALLKQIELGLEPPADLKRQYLVAANRLAQITSPVDNKPLSPIVINMIAESRTDLSTYLIRLVQGRVEDSVTWAKINNILVPIYMAAAKDKGIYLSVRQTGSRRWAIFRRMGGRQEQLEQVKDTNPEVYALVTQYHQTLDEITGNIQQKIIDSGLQPQQSFMAGRKVLLGIDPGSGEQHVYDLDGSILTPKEFLDKRTDLQKANKKLSRAHNRTTVPAAHLRLLSDEDVDRLSGPLEMVAITDDKAKQSQATRIFPVKRKPIFVGGANETDITSLKVIVSGRFKGCLLDDVVNDAGRLIEGTAYSYDPSSNRSRSVPKKIDIRNREPYVSVGTPTDIRNTPDGVEKTQTEKLYVRIPNTHAMSELRDAMKLLACNSASNYSKKGCVPSIEWVPLTESRAAGFYFEPKDFGLVMDTLQGLALSSAALQKVKSYYKDLANAEAATVKQNLKHYTAASIGGFKTHRKNRNGELIPVTLTTKQKQSLAWLDANGNKGVCGLDTGTGKTLLCISAMQKMIRDGLTDQEASYTKPDGETVQTNGRFLYVCPPSLKGNLTKEMRSFLSEAGLLVERTDRMTYSEYRNSMKSGMWRRKPWNPAAYVAVFFDEAQELLSKSRTEPTKKPEPALALQHPRKICLTASPIDSDPMEAYILSAICNNKQLNGEAPEVRENRKEMYRFRDRFCETVGGRIIGVKQNPNLKRDLAVWVRRNIFFADKQDVDLEAGETPLSTLRDGTQAITMDPAVEVMYRGITKRFAAAMGSMVKLFRDREIGTGKTTEATVEMEAMLAAPKFGPIMKLLNDLSNYPEDALRDIIDMIRTGEYVNAKGVRGPIPPILAGIVDQWRNKIRLDDLHVVASRVGNPKLTSATEIIKKRLERSKGNSRTLLFSDDRDMCWKSVRQMASQVAGMHAIALDREIHIFDGGRPLTDLAFVIDEDAVARILGNPEKAREYVDAHNGIATITLPFRKKSYRKYMDLFVGPDNVKYAVGDWQTFALNEISANHGIKSLTLLGSSYKLGQNLQAFDTVIHLDRDTWNAETMKQRTARAWRQGQENPVTEITLDTVYQDQGDSDQDHTLDQIRKYFQMMGKSLFEEIIKQSQGFALGGEWSGMAKVPASMAKTDQKMFDLTMSPYASRSVVPGA